jgi:quinol monooxygenase YgiN
MRGAGLPRAYHPGVVEDGAIVYVDRSRIRPGKADALLAALADLGALVEAREDQIVAYQVHVDERRSSVSVIHIHADADSLDRHLAVAGPEFPKFADLVELQSIDVYGAPSDAAIAGLRAKGELLGGASVSIHPKAAGFARLRALAAASTGRE